MFQILSPQDSELETAYREGREAAQAGHKTHHYPLNSPLAFAWQVGWYHMNQEMRDVEEGQYIFQ